MTPILYEKDEIDFTSQGLGSLVEIYDVDVEEQRNGLLQLTASYPVSGLRYADISVGRIILAKPNQRDDVHAFRIVSTELDISGYAVTIEADSITYDLTHNLVKHLNVSGNGQAFMTALKNAVVNPSIFAFYSDIATSSTTSLDYVNPMEAIMGTTGSFLQIWGGELKRENRRVAMFNRRGRDNVSTFRLGKNIAGLKYSVDISSLVTRIIPTKSVQNDDQTTTTLEGTPVDSQYINNYEQIYTLPLEFTDDTIKTVADLNTAAKGWFTKSANTGRDKPTVTIDIDVLSLQDSADYQDKFKNLESVSLTDTVTVYVPEYGVNVTTIVNELHYDPILDRVTKMTVGTAKQSFADSSRTQLSDLQDKIISVQNQADAAAVSANGKSTNYYGSVEPSHPQEGDTWFWVNGDKSGVKVFVNGEWVEPVDSDTQEKIEAGVTEAVAQANAHTDEVKQGLSTDIDTAKSQAASQANTAEENAKSAATSQFNQAKDALAEAKSNLQNDIDKSKGDIVEINQTLTGFDGTLQRVQDTVNRLGQTNQLMNTEFTPDFQSWNADTGYELSSGIPTYDGSNVVHIKTTNTGFDYIQQFVPVVPGQVISFSTMMKFAPTAPDNSTVYWRYAINFYQASGGSSLGTTYGLANFQTLDWTLQKSENIVAPDNTAYVKINYYMRGAGEAWLAKPMLVFESAVGTYVQGNYNNNDALAQVKLTADKASLDLSTYQIDADGRIGKAQTDITATANQVATKVSQNDYDTKTGQLTTSVSKAQQTADSATTSLANYKQDTDGRITANTTDIEANANAIKQKVAQSDYNANNQQLTSRLTMVETTANGTATTVYNLQQTVNNLGQVNQLFNTEFTPDLQGWEIDQTITATIDSTQNHNGSNVLILKHDSSSTWGAYRQSINNFVPGGVLSVRTWCGGNSGTFQMNVESYNSSGVRTVIKRFVFDNSNADIKVENITIPSDATKLYLSFWSGSAGTVVISQPMLVFASNVGTYVQGNYNNNAALAQVKITADGIDKFVRDSSGNISSDFQTALSKTSIITGSTLATSIQKQTATQITSALTDNNGKIISLINQDSSGVQIAGKNLAITADTTVDGNFWAKQVNAVQVNASNITVGTLNGSQVNITNINANNIVSGAISGANLNINLNTGSVVFQKGRINSSDYTTDINIDQGYISTANSTTRALLSQGKLQLVAPNIFSPQTTPYLEISNDSYAFNGMAALIKARDSLTVSINGHDERNYNTPLGTETFVGMSIGNDINNELLPTKIGGANQGVVISGGNDFTLSGQTLRPFIYVGTNIYGSQSGGDSVYIRSSYLYSQSTYLRTTSSSANVVVNGDGALIRSSSARKYKLDIKNNISIDDSLKLIEVPLSTWVDKHEHEENGSNERYFGMIAEDLRDAGLEYLVQYGEDNEVEGINYDRVALLLIPLVKELKERIEELESKGK